ncbi:MAG TPA: hypothetical protein VK327_17855 [Candidatus Paceibacterota bacterium]|nr:hypothetical protein [Candidatus Paceibacterota bacterium]
MTLNQLPDDVWLAVVDGNTSIQCEFLALSFLITNLKTRRRAGGTPAEIAAEFKKFFTKYGQLPAAQRDLAKIAQLRGYHV